jgi:hypothetical protein
MPVFFFLQGENDALGSMFLDRQNLIFNLFIPENAFKNQYKNLKTSKHHKIILKTKTNQIKKLKEPDQLFSSYLG